MKQKVQNIPQLLHIVIRTNSEQSIHSGFIYNPLSVMTNSKAKKIHDNFYLPSYEYVTVCIKTKNTIKDICSALQARLQITTETIIPHLVGTFTFSREMSELLLHEVLNNSRTYAA